MCVDREWVNAIFLCWINKENFVDDKKRIGIRHSDYQLQSAVISLLSVVWNLQTRELVLPF